MKFSPAKSLFVCLIAAALPLSAQAHRTWLLPSATVVYGHEGWVTFDAAVSEDLFDLDTNALPLDNLLILGPDGLPVQAENEFKGRLRSVFDLKLTQPGTYRVRLERENVMASYKLNGQPKRWRGDEKDMGSEIPKTAEDLHVMRASVRQETFVTLGKANDTALTKVNGVGIELVPITHPNEMFVGTTSRFRLLLDGKPLAHHLIGIVPGGVRYRGVLNEITATTDAKGELSVKWPAAGMYWLSASWPVRSEGGPRTLPPRRVSYSATLEVLPE